MKEITVAVGMSGGVDSSATALLLKKQGYTVIGITMRLFSHHDREIEVASSICEKLDIEHRVLDFQDEFKAKVISLFQKKYESGETPNPCLYCNREFKYGMLLDYCMEQGIDYFATGHYVKKEFDSERGIYRLFRSSAERKDQSYNLFQLNQAQLSRLLFPLSQFKSKDEVRAVSQTISNSISKKKDSNGICFLNRESLYSFLKREASPATEAGLFVSMDGVFLGRHKGICAYTLGQKKGLPASDGEPYVVVEIRAKENKVVLGSEGDLLVDRVFLSDFHTIDPDLSLPLKVSCKLSQWSETYSGRLYRKNASVFVEFDTPARAPSPGQGLVLYHGDELVGGGYIKTP